MSRFLPGSEGVGRLSSKPEGSEAAGTLVGAQGSVARFRCSEVPGDEWNCRGETDPKAGQHCHCCYAAELEGQNGLDLAWKAVVAEV